MQRSPRNSVRRHEDFRREDRARAPGRRSAAYWTESNDHEFSRYSIDEHWQAGRADVMRTLNHPAWKNRTPPEEGVHVFDLTREIDTDPKEPAM